MPKYKFAVKDKAKIKSGILVVLLAVLVMAGVFNKDFYTGLMKADITTTPLPPMPKAELLVEKVHTFPAEPKVGDTLEVKIKVFNLGNQDADKLKIKLVDEKGWGKVQNISVKQKLYRYVDFALPVLAEHKGNHHFKVILDTRNEVEENDKENNQVEFELEVK